MKQGDRHGYSTVLEMPVELQLRLMNYYMESFEYVDIDGVSKDSIKYKDKLIVIGINGKTEFAVKTNIKGLEQALGGGPRRITSLPDIHDSITSLFVNNQAKYGSAGT